MHKSEAPIAKGPFAMDLGTKGRLDLQPRFLWLRLVRWGLLVNGDMAFQLKLVKALRIMVIGRLILL